MCSCDEGAVCLAHRGTPLDPLYLLSHLPDGEDEYEVEPHVSEFEVRDA